MRHLPAAKRRIASARLVTTRSGLALGMAVAVLGTAACAGAKTEQPQSRLGAQSGKDGYQWNGNASRRGYDAKNLDGVNGVNGGSHGGRAGASQPGDIVLFQSDSAELTAESKAMLDGMIAQLRAKPIRALSIEGHADERGTREYNLALGAKRATAVKSYLVSKGMLDSQVRTISFGKERPVVSCDDISCWAKNRRAQVVVADK